MRLVLGVKYQSNKNEIKQQCERTMNIFATLPNHYDRITCLREYKMSLSKHYGLKIEKLRHAIKIHTEYKQNWQIVNQLLMAQYNKHNYKLKIISFLQTYHGLLSAMDRNKSICHFEFPDDLIYFIAQFAGSACVAHCLPCGKKFCLHETSHSIYNRLYSTNTVTWVLICNGCMAKGKSPAKNGKKLSKSDHYTLYGTRPYGMSNFFAYLDPYRPKSVGY